jgi:hypothetical protein
MANRWKIESEPGSWRPPVRTMWRTAIRFFLLSLVLAAAPIIAAEPKGAAVPGSDDLTRYTASKTTFGGQTTLRTPSGQTLGTASTTGTRTTFRDSAGRTTGTASIEGNRTVFRDSAAHSGRRRHQPAGPPPTVTLPDGPWAPRPKLVDARPSATLAVAPRPPLRKPERLQRSTIPLDGHWAPSRLREKRRRHPLSADGESWKRRKKWQEQSGSHFNHRIERAVPIQDILTGQQVGHPLAIAHELVFIAPRR